MHRGPNQGTCPHEALGTVARRCPGRMARPECLGTLRALEFSRVGSRQPRVPINSRYERPCAVRRSRPDVPILLRSRCPIQVRVP